ncbi:MAG: hypothetical protein R3B95_08225 [Nitrospirales bacterium]|nr:hypothetical protein [Nitrospirales bacterium]
MTKPTGTRPRPRIKSGSWDITRLWRRRFSDSSFGYLVMDILGSRKIVAWEVYETETAEQAAAVIHQACLIEGVHRDQLALHSDNGAPMKGATMVAMLHKLGIILPQLPIRQ